MRAPVATPSEFCKNEFDYLIVGGGTAGLAVAARLGEDPSITVGILEAGPAAFDEITIDIPGRFGETIGSKYDWAFETTDQPGLGGRKLPWPRGRVLGGTSALNFMTWNRGNKRDYDAWEELGNEGWGWDSMLPFFKKSETFHQPTPEHQERHRSYFTPEFHGTDGPIHTVHSSEYSVPHQYWHETMNNLGLSTNRSHLSGSNVGVWTSVTNVEPKMRKRCYSAVGYYLPNSNRKNLIALTDATVTEIVLEQVQGDTWMSKGVKFQSGGDSFFARVSHEVIICAGSVQSPQLLELSGIGDRAILDRACVSVKIDNKNVGENLQEHMMTAAIYEVSDQCTSPDDLRADPDLAKEADLAYSQSQVGPRTIIPCSLSYMPLTQFVPISELDAYASRVIASGSKKTLRDETLLSKFSSRNFGNVEFIFDVGNWSPFYASVPGKKYATLLQIYQYPFSKGSIHIGSKSVDDKPIIDPRYFQGPGGQVDFEMMALAQRFGDKIARTAPLSDIVVKRVFPPERKDPSNEKEDFSDWLRRTCITDWHPVGTCAMGGKEGKNGGVVDERLRVYGVKDLRVVDASIFPLQIASHPQATIYAIAEKAASMILEDRRKQTNGIH